MSIGSGSSGNCIFVAGDRNNILIDTGLAKKRVKEGLEKVGCTLDDISAILITHEHSDHVKGLGVILREKSIPVYATRGTINAIKRKKNLGRMDFDLFNEIKADTEFKIDGMKILPIRTDHDANEPVCYRISEGGKSLAIVTDIGTYNSYTCNNLKNLDAILIEANHDIRMLEVGPYSLELKRRILSNIGHMSNETSGRLLCEIINSRLKKVFLGHISSENNYPDLALQAVKMEIDMSDTKYKSSDFDIELALKDACSSIYVF